MPSLRNALFVQAERYWTISIVLAVLVLFATLLGLWMQSTNLISIVGVLSLLLPVAISWLREMASASQLQADKCRRLILLADGLGQPIAPAELAEVRAWGLGVPAHGAVFISPYYSSNYPVGYQRLADICAEAAFFTEQLASRLSARMSIVFIGAVVLSIAALNLLDLSGNVVQVGVLLSAKSIATFMAFLISGDFLVIAKKYRDLSYAAQRSYQKFSHLRNDALASPEEIRAQIEDYSVALTQCPPLPTWFYHRYRDNLNAVYRASHGE